MAKNINPWESDWNSLEDNFEEVTSWSSFVNITSMATFTHSDRIAWYRVSDVLVDDERQCYPQHQQRYPPAFNTHHHHPHQRPFGHNHPFFAPQMNSNRYLEPFAVNSGPQSNPYEMNSDGFRHQHQQRHLPGFSLNGPHSPVASTRARERSGRFEITREPMSLGFEPAMSQVTQQQGYSTLTPRRPPRHQVCDFELKPGRPGDSVASRTRSKSSGVVPSIAGNLRAQPQPGTVTAGHLGLVGAGTTNNKSSSYLTSANAATGFVPGGKVGDETQGRKSRWAKFFSHQPSSAASGSSGGGGCFGTFNICNLYILLLPCIPYKPLTLHLVM